MEDKYSPVDPGTVPNRELVSSLAALIGDPTAVFVFRKEVNFQMVFVLRTSTVEHH